MKIYNLKQKFLALAMIASLGVIVPISGCSTAWTTTFDNILVAAAPSIVDIISIVDIAENKPLDTAEINKINADAANLKAMAADFEAASAAAAPTACAQLQAAVQTFAADVAYVTSIAQVSDPATQTKVQTLVVLVSGTVAAITAVIPACQTPAQLKATFGKAPVPVPLKTFIGSYNTVLVTPTGNAKIDSFTKSHKIHVHSKFVRILTFGHSY
jgi:hypothetical protein